MIHLHMYRPCPRRDLLLITGSSLIHSDVYPIAVFREESYQSLKLAMSDICAEGKDLELLTLDDETFQVHSMHVNKHLSTVIDVIVFIFLPD